MKCLKYILGLFILIQSLNVFAQRVVSDSLVQNFNEHLQVKKIKYKFYSSRNIERVKEATKQGIIDTNVVYLRVDYDRKSGDTVYSFLRFFSTGEVFESWDFHNLPSIEQLNDLNYGFWSMYAIKNKNLIIEYYQRGFSIKSHFYYANVEKSKLMFYKYRVGWFFTNSTKPLNHIFYRTETNLYNYNLTW